MTREEISAKVMELAAEQAGVNVSEVCPATHFVNDLNFDSLDLVEYVMALEDEFGISVDDETAQRTQTVAEAVELVSARLDTLGKEAA